MSDANDDAMKEISNFVVEKLKGLGLGGNFVLLFESEPNLEGGGSHIGMLSTTPPDVTKHIIDMMSNRGNLSNPRVIDVRKEKQN